MSDSVGASLPGAARLAALLRELTSRDELAGILASAQASAEWLIAHGVSVGAALETPCEPSEAAIRAAAPYFVDRNITDMSQVASGLRAAYAVDGGAALEAGPAFADNRGIVGALQDIAYQARYDRTHAMLGGPTDPFEYYERISRTALAAVAVAQWTPDAERLASLLTQRWGDMGRKLGASAAEIAAASAGDAQWLIAHGVGVRGESLPSDTKIAPRGSWVADQLYPQGHWRVRRAVEIPGEWSQFGIHWFRSEAEAIAVRDALNRAPVSGNVVGRVGGEEP